MKKLILICLLFGSIAATTKAQGIYDKLKANLPKQLGTMEMFDPAEMFTNGEDTHLMANYNGDINTYLNVTFTLYSESVIKRLSTDLANAPKSFEDDEMSMEAFTLGNKNGQLTTVKEQPRFEVTVIDKQANLLYSFTEAGIKEKEEIMKVVQKVVQTLD